MALTEEEEEELESLIEVVNYSWVIVAKDKYKLLHHPGTTTPDVREWAYRRGNLACGLEVARADVPGVFSRMSLDRCPECCEATGFPKGRGSPKNDDECRKVLGLKIDEEPER